MVNDLRKRVEPVEKITLETQHHGWVAFSIGGCGILTRALVGRHETRYRESRSIALAFTHLVVQAVGLSPAHDRVSTPQILVDAADAVIDDPEHVFLLGTTWQYLPEGVEICSVGSNSVLVFENDVVREAIIPHTVNELLRSQGKTPHPINRLQITHALGSKKSEKSCYIDEVRVALIPLLPTTTIAIIVEPLLANAMQEHAVAKNEIVSFIEAWNAPGKKITTSVLISL